MQRTDEVFPEVTLRLPRWVGELSSDGGRRYRTVEDRMRFAVELSRLNVRHGTGGPFGAAIFERASGRLLAPGVNLVVGSGCSVFHAEMVAIMVAQKVLGTFDLGGDNLPSYELVATTEPCAMCLGATPWSGARHLVCGARDEDARAVGFDEGVKPALWVGALEERGITVERDVLREEAVAVLREYTELGGEIYNSRQGERGDPR
ncbi:MAG TPA: nucleoside deaminase [Rubrobacter sp.]|nr:nucleoside deaminase [Rubrobacter sp.]